jgi:hypothetical protein
MEERGGPPARRTAMIDSNPLRVSVHLPRRLRAPTATERNFWSGAWLTVAVILVFQLARWLEQDVLHLDGGQRLVVDASRASTLYFGIPHFVIGFLFMVTAPRNRSGQRQLMIGALAAVGLGLCWLWSSFGGPVRGSRGANIGQALFMGYFLVHVLRDEAFFFRRAVLGGDTTATDRFDRLSNGLIALVVTWVLAATWMGLAIGMFHRAPQLFPQELPSGVRGSIALAPMVAWALAGWTYLRKQANDGFGTVGGLLRTYAPLLRVFAAILLFFAIGASITGKGYPFITLHYMAWYVFTCALLAERPVDASASDNWWSWIRNTPNGFRALHFGLLAVVIALSAVWIHGLEREGWLWYVLSKEALYYWTIVHVTVSFVPR